MKILFCCTRAFLFLYNKNFSSTFNCLETVKGLASTGSIKKRNQSLLCLKVQLSRYKIKRNTVEEDILKLEIIFQDTLTIKLKVSERILKDTTNYRFDNALIFV